MNLTLVSLQKRGAAPLDTLEFSNALIEIGVIHTLILSAENELGVEFSDNEFRKVIRIRTFSSSKASFLNATFGIVRPLALWRALSVGKPNILFSTHFHPWLFIAKIYQLTRKGVRWAYGIHESPFWNKEGRGVIESALEKWFIRSADIIFCYSEFIARNLRAHMQNKKIIALRVGAHTAGFQILQKTPATAPIPPKHALRVVCVGRIETHKGIDMLIESARLLSGTIPFEILIAGSGSTPLPENIPTEVSILRTWLSISDIAEIYSSADIVAVPYRNASQSGSPAWAMAAGVPIVSTDSGGLKEQVLHKKTGLIVPSQNPEAFAHALRLLLSDDALRVSMGARAKSEAEAMFSWKMIARTFLTEL